MSERTDLTDHLTTIARQWVLILVAVVLGALAAGLLSLTRPTLYTAHASVLVPPPVGTTSASSGVVVSVEEVATQAEVASSAPVASEAVRILQEQGVRTSASEVMQGVSVAPVGESRVLQVSVQAPSGDVAAERADAVAQGYIAYTSTLADAGQRTTLDNTSREVSDVLAQIDAVERRLRTATGSAKDDLTLRRQMLQTELGMLTQQADTALTSRVVQGSGAALLESAAVPGSPSSPATGLNVALGAVLGGMLGVMTALLRAQVAPTSRRAVRRGRAVPQGRSQPQAV